MKTVVNNNKRGFAALFLLIIMMVGILVHLARIQIIKGDEYSAKVESQQLGDTEIKASRGTIYDANMNIMAQSASAWRVFLNPSKIKELDEDVQETARGIIASGLATILDMDEETILEYTKRDYAYQLVKGSIEKGTRDAVYDFIDKYNNRGDDSIYLGNIVCIDPDVKRYYPYSSLASTVIGFTGDSGIGRAGLEYYYDDILTGVSGRTIKAVDGNQNVMPNQYETIFEAQQGTGLVLTLDIYVQYILEDVLSQALENTNAENIFGIVMDVDTGAILGMVSLPDYDLNDPYAIKSEDLMAQYIEAASAPENESESESAKEKRKKSYYQYRQWDNKAISSTYEPGSVFKVITSSAAIEEGKASMNTSYYCSGVIDYATRKIKCWKAGGHGSETFIDLLKNSCNPFAVTLANELGTDIFYDYFEAFGFAEKTGIDTTGDFSPTEGVLYMPRSNFSKSDLASYSFGQSFQVSPLQVITAISAVANGGKLMTPYLVSRTVDANGNTISETTPTVRRQVISESTANLIAQCMEEVVSTGTGKNAYVAGYHVAGKTGTSEKLTAGDDEAYIASFCGFAPANDPQISVIIVVDEPEGEHGGGAVAAPLAGEVFDQVLTYLGVEHAYSDKEMALLVENTPYLIGKTVSEAHAEVSDTDLSVRVIGDGDTVVAQSPDAGRELPSDGIIILYTDTDYSPKTVTVPNFTGLTVSEVNRVATSNGLNIRISGSSLNSGTVYAYKQSIDAGETVKMGEIITVYFKTTVDVAD